jgi:ATP-dependent Clp protease protease subunit
MAIKAAKQGDTLDLEMSGVVGDGWSDTAITSKAVGKVLRDNPDAKTIRIALNSPGGYVVEGSQIYQMLVDHPARVEVTVGAQAASCGSLIAMAGDKVTLHETSLFLIHNPWNLTIGDYIDHEKAAKELQMMADMFASVYAKRSGMSKEDVQKLMDEDRYMNAEEAKNLGFADNILESKKKEKALSANDARSQLMRSRNHAMSRVMQAAAAALYQPTETPEPSATAETENPKNMAQLAVILAALCLADGVSDAEATASINGLRAAKDSNGKLLEAIGAKSLDEALGTVKALREKGEQYDGLVAEREAEKAQAIAAKKADLIAKASVPAGEKADPSNPHAGKLVPAQKAWAEGSTLEYLEGWVVNAPVVLRASANKPPEDGGSGYAGKSYDKMSNKERADCRRDNPELFKTLRAEAQRKGLL